MASDDQQTLVLFTEEGMVKLFAYRNREDAEADIEELEALVAEGHTMQHVSGEILQPQRNRRPLVDEFLDGRDLAQHLRDLGYFRQSGVWLYHGYEGIPMTLPEAIKHAIAAGRWRE